MASHWGGDTLERPVSWVDAIFSIEDHVIDLEMVVISVEEYLDRFATMTRDKVEV